MVTIQELLEELQALVRSVASFSASGFSVFDVDDLESLGEAQGYPLAGVAYDGAMPAENRNQVIPVADKASAAAIATIQFTIILAVQYHYAGQEDTKTQATWLLDDLRKLVFGYKGVNSRPWRWAGERPERPISGDGLVFYSQSWQTDIPVIGNFNNV